MESLDVHTVKILCIHYEDKSRVPRRFCKDYNSLIVVVHGRYGRSRKVPPQALVYVQQDKGLSHQPQMSIILLFTLGRVKEKSFWFIGNSTFNAPYFKRFFESVIIMTLRNWNTWVLCASNLICLTKFYFLL